MMHNQAISYVNEIKAACESMSQEDIASIEIKRNPRFAIGYIIMISSFLNSVCKHQVATIAKKHRLILEEKHDGLIIYQPKKAANS